MQIRWLSALFFLGSLVSSLGCDGSDTEGTGGDGGAAAASSSSSTGGMGGAGGAPCVPVDDANPCTDDLSEDNVPVHKPTPAGAALPVQTPGDCKNEVCDGNGKVTPVPDDADVPLDDGNPCTDEACSAGAPSPSSNR